MYALNIYEFHAYTLLLALQAESIHCVTANGVPIFMVRWSRERRPHRNLAISRSTPVLSTCMILLLEKSRYVVLEHFKVRRCSRMGTKLHDSSDLECLEMMLVGLVGKMAPESRHKA